MNLLRELMSLPAKRKTCFRIARLGLRDPATGAGIEHDLAGVVALPSTKKTQENLLRDVIDVCRTADAPTRQIPAQRLLPVSKPISQAFWPCAATCQWTPYRTDSSPVIVTGRGGRLAPGGHGL